MFIGYGIGYTQVPKYNTSSQLTAFNFTPNRACNLSSILGLTIVYQCIVRAPYVNACSW